VGAQGNRKAAANDDSVVRQLIRQKIQKWCERKVTAGEFVAAFVPAALNPCRACRADVPIAAKLPRDGDNP
jgi:hypothetical protein